MKYWNRKERWRWAEPPTAQVRGGSAHLTRTSHIHTKVSYSSTCPAVPERTTSWGGRSKVRGDQEDSKCVCGGGHWEDMFSSSEGPAAPAVGGGGGSCPAPPAPHFTWILSRTFLWALTCRTFGSKGTSREHQVGSGRTELQSVRKSRKSEPEPDWSCEQNSGNFRTRTGLNRLGLIRTCEGNDVNVLLLRVTQNRTGRVRTNPHVYSQLAAMVLDPRVGQASGSRERSSSEANTGARNGAVRLRARADWGERARPAAFNWLGGYGKPLGP